MEKLIIVGCGPKAVAISVKAHVLKELGWKVPEITVIDKSGVAANWDGTNGFTDGSCLLGTTPFEDVGFPYDSQLAPEVDAAMLQYSYMAYQVDIGKYAEWVDRALNPPTHGMLAGYYKWLRDKIDFSVTIGIVTAVAATDDKWTVTYEDTSGTKHVTADGLVMTGAGEPYRFTHVNLSEAEERRIFDGQTIWHNLEHLKGKADARFAVIGAGETSAGIVTALLSSVADSTQIEVITRHPILFTRNEHWMEVMYFSKVMDWAQLTKSEKLEVIHHADRGTFSVAAKSLLDGAYNIAVRLGNAERIEAVDGRLHVVLSGRDEEQWADYDYVVEATGFDPYSFTYLFDDKSFLENAVPLNERIEHDLSVTALTPRLHLPNLAALAQGPGFPNLSCLGLLSERILTPYIDKPANRHD